MKRFFHLAGVCCTVVVIACEGGVAPTADEAADPIRLVPSAGPVAHGGGGGHYVLALGDAAFPGTFSFTAKQFADGRAQGQFRYTLDLTGHPDLIDEGIADFHGRVTCVSVDLAEGRLWVGGVVTQNRSTQPFYRDDPTTQVGRDIWFRVLDTGEGQGPPDRTTFTGFEGGAGIITSQEYCDVQPWPGPPDDPPNARTHPVQGNIQVHD